MLLRESFFVHLVLTIILLPRFTWAESWEESNQIDDSGSSQSWSGSRRNFFWEKQPPKIQQNDMSSPEDCARACEDGEPPRFCYYQFTMEFYTTMGRACELCKPNNTNQITNIPSCQCVEADGVERGMLAINRMLPGPSIQVCLNDRIVIDVHNNIEGMEVGLHWHGIWQQGSQYYDGVPFLTQCPIPSGTTFRYQFIAGNPGTHFYHSHAGIQKIDGQYGSLIVRQAPRMEPHMTLYDEDLLTHVILLSDWMHEMGTERFPGRVRNNPGQIPENILINGKGRWTDPATKKRTQVQLESFLVQSGKRYRFRMINSLSSVCPVQMTIEGHSVLLIAQDGESVKPVPVNTIVSTSGERVDFILTANQAVGAYWIQVRALGECVRFNPNQLAILRYARGPENPQTPEPGYQLGLEQGTIYNPPDGDCETVRNNVVCANQLKSIDPVSKEIMKAQADHRIILPFQFFTYNNSIQELFKPGTYSRYLVAADADHITSIVDGISFSFPKAPPVSQPITPSDTCNRNNLPNDCGTVCQCPHTHHIRRGAVVEVVLYDEVSQPMLGHPFHLHGYAFRILKIGSFADKRNISKSDINAVLQEHQRMLDSAGYRQPPGKDTILVPQAGYVVFRFKADNPGWWLFHCHFLYHVSIGMNVVFHVGQRQDMPPVPPGFPKCYSYTPPVDMRIEGKAIGW